MKNEYSISDLKIAKVKKLSPDFAQTTTDNIKLLVRMTNNIFIDPCDTKVYRYSELNRLNNFSKELDGKEVVEKFCDLTDFLSSKHIPFPDITVNEEEIATLREYILFKIQKEKIKSDKFLRGQTKKESTLTREIFVDKAI